MVQEWEVEMVLSLEEGGEEERRTASHLPCPRAGGVMDRIYTEAFSIVQFIILLTVCPYIDMMAILYRYTPRVFDQVCAMISKKS